MSSTEREMSRSIVMFTVTPTILLILNSENPLLPRLKWMSQAISTQGASAVLFLLLPHAQPWLKTTGHSHLYPHLCFPQKGSYMFPACLKPTLSFTHKQSMLHQVFWAPPRLSVQYFKFVPFNALSMLCCFSKFRTNFKTFFYTFEIRKSKSLSLNLVGLNK